MQMNDTLKAKVYMMKRLLTGLGTLLVLAMVTTDAMAQKRLGKGGGQGRGASASGIQTRAGNQGQAAQTQRGNQDRQSSHLVSTSTGSPDLLWMREEEKLARDVYTSLAKSSGLTIFSNIARAESQHMQAIERLIRSGGANAVNLNNAPGMFVFPEHQQLYTAMIANGTRSQLDALMVGAKIEEMDIADLNRLLTQTTDPQVRQVLTHLMQGSQNHLRAFASQIAGLGSSYHAEFLTQAEFDQIANASGQRGGQKSAGRGAGIRRHGSQTNGQPFGSQLK